MDKRNNLRSSIGIISSRGNVEYFNVKGFIEYYIGWRKIGFFFNIWIYVNDILEF